MLRAYKRYVIQRLPGSIVEQIDRLKPGLGNTRPQVIGALLGLHGQGATPAVGDVANLEGLLETVLKANHPQPVCLNGPPYLGKSFTLEKFLTKLVAAPVPFVCFDNGENQIWIKDVIEYRDFSGFDWPREGGHRVTFSSDPGYRRQDFERVIQDLGRAIGEGKTADYVLVFEDCLEFATIEAFRVFLATIRKHVRLAIAVSQDFEPFKRFCLPMRPIPRVHS